MASDTPYTGEFYAEFAEASASSAAVVVPLFLSLLPVKSVIDVGCGTGIWARAFLSNGVADVVGVDGEYVDRSSLLIPSELFLARDLTHPLELGRTFDVAVCLEVAEHLPPAKADGFIRELTRLAPCVLFSAAVPGQGGTNHLNEQYLSYWVEIFRKYDYTGMDALRPLILDSPSVLMWYQQNTVVFAAPGHPLLARGFPHPPDIIHRDLYDAWRRQAQRKPGLKMLLREFPAAVSRSIRYRMGIGRTPVGGRRQTSE